MPKFETIMFDKGDNMNIIRLIPIFLLSIFVVNNAYSKEIPKGTVEVSGDSSFSIGSSEAKQDGVSGSEDTDTLLLSVTATYYVAPNVGVGMFWSKEDEEVDDGINSASSNINIIGPVVGYNVSIDPNSSLAFFAGIVLIGDYEREVNGFTTSEGDISGHVLGADFKHFVADSVSVNVGFAISSLTIEEDGGSDVDIDSTDLSVGLSVYFM